MFVPKRIIDFEALWASDKLAACQEQNRVEYAWLYGLADANGSFEITNLRVVWGKVSPVRPSLTLDRLGDIFRDFESHGLLFTWQEQGKKFAHWTGSEKTGRLPHASHRARYLSLAPQIPKDQLLCYQEKHGMIESGVNPDKLRTGLGFGVGLELDGKGREQRSAQPMDWALSEDGHAVVRPSCQKEIQNSRAAARHHSEVCLGKSA